MGELGYAAIDQGGRAGRLQATAYTFIDIDQGPIGAAATCDEPSGNHREMPADKFEFLGIARAGIGWNYASHGIFADHYARTFV
jgi:hypothetical protein